MSCQINRKCNNLPYYLLPGAVVEFLHQGYKSVTHSRQAYFYLHTKVVNLESNTFGSPIFQTGLQNQPSSQIISIPGCFAQLCRLLKNQKSNILAHHDRMKMLEKASWDTYKQGGWLILKDLLKNWVDEGVAFGVNNFITIYSRNASQGHLI